MPKDCVLFLCAHNDDHIIGGGGTIAKYARENKKVVTIIFSYGETSMPYLQKKVIRKTRVLESKKASRLLGESEVYYLGLNEGSFKKEASEKDIYSKIAVIIDRIKPSKIFTHSIDDPHPDHRAVYNFTVDLSKMIKYSGEIYSFNVWNLFLNIRKRNVPQLVVDITSTFQVKLEALKKHKSQIATILTLLWNVYLQALINGLNNHMKYAEVFYKIK